MTDTAQRTAIVTGAGQGLGEAIARALSAAGMHIVVADIAPEAAKQVADSLPDATAATVDVRSKQQLADMVDSVLQAHGTIDVLVNNAGITVSKPVWEIEQDEWDNVMAVNLRSVLFACQLVAPIMRDQKHGRIVNLTSLAGQQGGLVAGAHYAASKAGIIVLTKILARDLASHGVTVNAVAPAAIDGPIMQAMPPERITTMAATIPVGRVGTPDEVGALVAFLCAPEAAYITGSTMDINGGVFMR